jgi:hypothetical protein
LLQKYDEFRPPLANQLFDNRQAFVAAMQNYGDCKPLVNLLRGDVRVEQKLAKFEEQAKAFPRRRRQLVAIRYYLQQMLWECEARWRAEHRGITNHATFLDQVERWRFEKREKVCLVTFNYDTMIEHAMEQELGFRFDHFGRYITDERYSLIKLHGSVDWGRAILVPASPRSTQQVLDETEALMLSDGYEKVSGTPVRFADGRIGFPALAIPVENKSEFVCPPEHLKALADVIPQVTKIISIGWRGTEQNFLNMLRSPLTGLKGGVDLMVVSGDVEGVRQTNINLGLVNPRPGRRYPTIIAGFSGLIRNIDQLEQFLW